MKHRHLFSLLFCVLLLAPTATSAQAPGDESCGELRLLNDNVAALVQVVSTWAADTGKTDLIRQLTELDRSIALLSGELRGLEEERDALTARIEEINIDIVRSRRFLRDLDDPAGVDTDLQQMLEALNNSATDLEAALRAREAEIPRKEARLVSVDRRIEEVEDTLDARRALRATLEEKLEPAR